MKSKRILIPVVVVAVGVFAGVGIYVTKANREWEAIIVKRDQWRLAAAAGAGDLAVVRGYVEAGVDVNTSGALFTAITGGREDTVRYLLDHGANPNASDGWPLSTVCWADRWHHKPTIAKLLLEHGANPNVRDQYGRTPLTAAKNTEQDDLVLLLQQYGAHE